VAAYYYVKSGGTALGDAGRYASQQTGSFATMGAANYYDNIEDTKNATTGATNGDYICISDASAGSPYSANTTIISVGAGATDAPICLISVSDTAVEDYSEGASERTSSGDLTIAGNIFMAGFTPKPTDDLIYISDGSSLFMYECTLTTQGSGDISLNVMASSYVTLHSCTIAHGAGTNNFAINSSRNSYFYIYNLSIDITGDTPDYLISASGVVDVEIVGCDFSNAAMIAIIMAGSWNSTDDKQKSFTVSRCALHADTELYDGVPVARGQRALMTNSASISADAEYQYLLVDGQGTVEDETGIFRDGSTAYPSGQKAAMKCITVGAVTSLNPMIFGMATRYAKLSDTASDTVRLYFLSSAALDDGDVWAEVVYPDGTNKQTPNDKVSVTGPFDPWRTPGGLDTNTEAWTGRTTENRYQIDLDTSGDAGADCVLTIRVYVAKASATIYFCTSVDLM